MRDVIDKDSHDRLYNNGSFILMFQWIISLEEGKFLTNHKQSLPFLIFYQ